MQTHRFTVRHAVLHIRALKYLVGTRKYGLRYLSSNISTTSLELAAYIDSDWSGFQTMRKSSSEYLVIINNAPVSRKITRHTIEAFLFAEAEYIALLPAQRR